MAVAAVGAVAAVIAARVEAVVAIAVVALLAAVVALVQPLVRNASLSFWGSHRFIRILRLWIRNALFSLRILVVGSAFDWE